MSQSVRDSDPEARDRFATTHWTLVLAARDSTSPQARQALEALCQAYWYPLYAFIRRQGVPPDQADDFTQEFFARLLRKDFFETVDREKGKFRSFLLAACRHFLADERDRARAQKRGGGDATLSIDARDAERRFSLEPTHAITPEKLFERRWALTLLDQTLARLQQEFAAVGREHVFERLKTFLMADVSKVPYGQLAEELGATEGAVKVAVHRLRRRYGELLREAIGRTLGGPDQIEDEIQHLFAALAY